MCEDNCNQWHAHVSTDIKGESSVHVYLARTVTSTAFCCATSKGNTFCHT